MLLDKITDALSAKTLEPIVVPNSVQAYVQFKDNDKFLVDVQGKVKKKTAVNDVLNFVVPNPTANTTNEVANLLEPNMLSVVNTDSTPHTVVIVMQDTTGIEIDVELYRALLEIGEKLEWTPEDKWQVYKADGVKKNDDSAVIAALADIEALLTALNALVATAANQTTEIALLTAISGFTDGIEALLTTLNAKDFATAAKQDAQTVILTAISGFVDGIEGLLTTLNAKDFATQTTLALVKTNLDDIKTYLDGVEGLLTTLNAKDFATQTTLAAVLAKIQVLRGATPTLSNVASSAVSVTIVAANANRISVAIVNDSTQVLYVKYGATASPTSYTYKLLADDTLIVDDYTGIIDGIWAAAVGFARVTEVTP